MTVDSAAAAAGVPALANDAALFIVFNIGSGADNAANVSTTIETGCAAAGRELQLMCVDEPQRLGAIAADAVRRAQGCGGIVVAAGGDGTINAMAQDIENGELAAIVLKPVGRLAMLGLLMRGALGQLGTSERVLSFSFQTLVVNPAWPLATRRIKVATDGEITWLQLPLKFQVAPQPLRLIRPAGPAPNGQSA